MTVATGIIITCSGFLLGAAFSHWRVDYGVLWHEIMPGAIEAARIHYTDLIHSPTYLNLGIVGVGAIAITSLVFKLFTEGVSGWTFDSGSLVLYAAIAIVYTTNVQKAPAALEALSAHSSPFQQIELLKDLASSNCIIAVALTGTLALQSAQYYSNRGGGFEDSIVPVAAEAPSAPPAAEGSTSGSDSIGRSTVVKKRSSARLRALAQSQADS